MTYTISTTVEASFDDVVSAATTALQDEGFGLLSDIDVQTTLKQKLDVDVEQYRILGACNPTLAHEGLAKEPELGALLPCNVIVYETETGEVGVGAVDPEPLIGVTGNPELDDIAADVSDRFERVVSVVDEEFAGD